MAKAIREADGKKLLCRYFKSLSADEAWAIGRGLEVPCTAVTVRPDTDFADLAQRNPWLLEEVI